MEPTQITEEQQKDIDTRVEEFRARHIANVEELDVDFVTYPQYVQVAPNVFATTPAMQLIDKRYMSVPSPVTTEMVQEGGETVIE